jgi:hypothetical protein
MQQFAFTLQDAPWFLQNARLGIMAVSNNLGMLVAGWSQLAAKMGKGQSVFMHLIKTMMGPAGMVVALSLVVAGVQAVAMAMDSAGKAARDLAKKEMEALIEAIKNMSKMQMELMFEDATEAIKVTEKAIDDLLDKLFKFVETTKGGWVEVPRVLPEAERKRLEAALALAETRLSAQKDIVDALEEYIDGMDRAAEIEAVVTKLLSRRASKAVELNHYLKQARDIVENHNLKYEQRLALLTRIEEFEKRIAILRKSPADFAKEALELEEKGMRMNNEFALALAATELQKRLLGSKQEYDARKKEIEDLHKDELALLWERNKAKELGDREFGKLYQEALDRRREWDVNAEQEWLRRNKEILEEGKDDRIEAEKAALANLQELELQAVEDVTDRTILDAERAYDEAEARLKEDLENKLISQDQYDKARDNAETIYWMKVFRFLDEADARRMAAERRMQNWRMGAITRAAETRLDKDLASADAKYKKDLGVIEAERIRREKNNEEYKEYEEDLRLAWEAYLQSVTDGILKADKKIAKDREKSFRDFENEITRLSQLMANAFQHAGDKFVQYLQVALQLVLEIMRVMNRVKTGEKGPGGAFGDILSILGPLMMIATFQKGGYTGKRGGIVHPGEVVFEQELVRKHGEELMGLRKMLQKGGDFVPAVHGTFPQAITANENLLRNAAMALANVGAPSPAPVVVGGDFAGAEFTLKMNELIKALNEPGELEITGEVDISNGRIFLRKEMPEFEKFNVKKKAYASFNR